MRRRKCPWVRGSVKRMVEVLAEEVLEKGSKEASKSSEGLKKQFIIVINFVGH